MNKRFTMTSQRLSDGSWDVFQPEIEATDKKVIICGSRKYKNINFDELVDKFEVIIRHNMLLPNNNYGKRDSTFQIFNVHVHSNYIRNATLDLWISEYHEAFGIPKDHIRSFYDYLNAGPVKFKYFNENNTQVMRQQLRKHHIEHEIKTQIRCGIGSIADCIKKRIKPHLIGFGLKRNRALNKQYASKDGEAESHDECSEIELIKKLHRAGLVDATFCAIKDQQNIKIDSSLIKPTASSLKILEATFDIGD